MCLSYFPKVNYTFYTKVKHASPVVSVYSGYCSALWIILCSVYKLKLDNVSNFCEQRKRLLAVIFVFVMINCVLWFWLPKDEFVATKTEYMIFLRSLHFIFLPTIGWIVAFDEVMYFKKTYLKDLEQSDVEQVFEGDLKKL
eukprot:UN32832